MPIVMVRVVRVYLLHKTRFFNSLNKVMNANPARTDLNTQTENLQKALKNIGLITIMENLAYN